MVATRREQPADQRLNPVWKLRRDEVVAADGLWVMVAEDVWNNTAARIVKGQMAAFRPPSMFEVYRDTKGKSAGKCDVWVRVVDRSGETT